MKHLQLVYVLYYIYSTGPALDTLMQQLQSDLQATPPLPGSYNPHKGQLCAAQFSDGQWYVLRGF